MELNDKAYKKMTELSNKGNALMEKGKFKKAYAVFEKGLDLVPEPKNDWEASLWFYVSLGDAKFSLREYKVAEDWFFQACGHPDGTSNPYVLLRLGECLYELKNERGKEYLFRAYMMEGEEIFSEDDPKYFAAIEKIISGEEKLEVQKPAQIQKAKSLEGEAKAFFFAREEEACKWYVENNDEKAWECIDDMWNIIPEDKYAYGDTTLVIQEAVQYGFKRQAWNKLDLWMERFSELAQESPTYEDILAMWKGRVAFEKGNTEEAIEHFSHAYKLQGKRCFLKADEKYKDFFFSKKK